MQINELDFFFFSSVDYSKKNDHFSKSICINVHTRESFGIRLLKIYLSYSLFFTDYAFLFCFSFPKFLG